MFPCLLLSDELCLNTALAASAHSLLHGRVLRSLLEPRMVLVKDVYFPRFEAISRCKRIRICIGMYRVDELLSTYMRSTLFSVSAFTTATADEKIPYFLET
jgi:hypothetical protein